MEKYALVLGGGGARGAYEVGVWQALRELEIPIHIVTGTSVGALNGALVAQDRFDEAIEIWESMETHKVFDVEEDGKIRKPQTGTSGLEEIIHQYAQESDLRNSPVDFGIVTVQFPDMEPYELYMDQIPEGKIHDHILASASFFPALDYVEIDGQKFMDGGYHDVLPVNLAMQKNPDHIIAVYLDGAGILRRKNIEEAAKQVKSLHFIECQWNLGSVLAFDRDNSKRIMRLGYLDAMKSYEKYDGIKFTFERGIFTRHQLLGADAAADAFDLDPTVIYNKEKLISDLMLEIGNSTAADCCNTALEALRGQFSSKGIVLYIARDLLENQAESIFLKRAAFLVLKEEIQAANFLINNGLV